MSIGETKFLRKKTGSIDTKMSAARFIAETFKGYGLTHVFFVESILNRTLVEMEALGIKRVMTHSEKAAAYMADGYARAGHKLGLCMAQSVGAANLASGLQDPYLGLSPVVAITGKRPPAEMYRNAYQEIVHSPLFDPVTKYNVSIETADQLPYLLRQAFREATSGAPGPVHIDVAGLSGRVIEDAEVEFQPVVEESFGHYPSIRAEPEAEKVEEAIRVLEQAERPVIVAGGGAAISSAGPDILELAEMLSIPVATSLNGKGIILDRHPLSVGVVGSYSRWCANRVVSEADLVLFIGSHTSDQVTNGWTIPDRNTHVIQVDMDPSELGRNYPNTVPLLGDAKLTVQRMKGLVKKRGTKGQWVERAQALVKEWRAEAEPLRHSNDKPIRPERLCKEISDVLPADAILIADTGHAGIWTGTMVYLSHPAQAYIRCAGTLGWAFPASLGAKCAAPDRPVVCFTGDGGFWYHLSELETACRCGINTVTVVNNNHSFSQVVGLIDRAYGERPGKKSDLFNFREVNFAKISEEMGCLGIRVEDPGEISAALKKALASDRPALVDVVADSRCRAPAAWKPPPK